MCLKLCKSVRIRLNDKEILLRRPMLDDTKSILKLYNSLIEEGAQLSINKKLTFKEENEWMKNQLNLIKQDKLHRFVATYNEEIVGSIEMKKGMWRESHVGEIMGVVTEKQYRGIGLGTVMMKEMIKIAKQEPDIKVIYVRPFVTNKPAIGLYKKVGFKKVATLPKRHFYKGKYVDELIMDYPLNKI